MEALLHVDAPHVRTEPSGTKVQPRHGHTSLTMRAQVHWRDGLRQSQNGLQPARGPPLAPGARRRVDQHEAKEALQGNVRLQRAASPHQRPVPVLLHRLFQRTAGSRRSRAGGSSSCQEAARGAAGRTAAPASVRRRAMPTQQQQLLRPSRTKRMRARLRALKALKCSAVSTFEP